MSDQIETSTIKVVKELRRLLAIIEQGGYPDFRPLYSELGYHTTVVASVRKAITCLRSDKFDVVVAEFNFQSDFRDRTSSLESLLATLQRTPNTSTIVLFDLDYAHQLKRLQVSFPAIVPLPFPIDASLLRKSLEEAITCS